MCKNKAKNSQQFYPWTGPLIILMGGPLTPSTARGSGDLRHQLYNQPSGFASALAAIGYSWTDYTIKTVKGYTRRYARRLFCTPAYRVPSVALRPNLLYLQTHVEQGGFHGAFNGVKEGGRDISGLLHMEAVLIPFPEWSGRMFCEHKTFLLIRPLRVYMQTHTPSRTVTMALESGRGWWWASKSLRQVWKGGVVGGGDGGLETRSPQSSKETMVQSLLCGWEFRSVKPAANPVRVQNLGCNEGYGAKA
ncbi:hypothetical protein V8F20_000365 [Naviculisporaceae sp. PSN 640]